jgi:6-phosphogluconolactonase (cycloisomerase 2 family)
MGRGVGFGPVASKKLLASKKLWASVLTLVALPWVVACDNDSTLGYVYATSASASAGVINTYNINYQTGQLVALPDSPVPSGGRNPITLVADPVNHIFLYVLNHDDSNVVQVGIGTDGKLYPDNTYNTTGSFPTAAAISPDGKYLYVTYTYQSCLSTNMEQNGGTNPNCSGSENGFTTASPGPGGITIYPINSDNSLATPMDLPIGKTPIGIVTSGDGNYVYVVSQDPAATSTVTGQTGNLFAFSRNATTGKLTPLAGSPINTVTGDVSSNGYPAGKLPGGVIEDSSSAHLYVTDFSGNMVYGYTIANGIPTQTGSALTDAGPEGMALTPNGQYLYTANYTGGTIGGYSITSGMPVAVNTGQNAQAGQSTQAGTGVTCVTIEQQLGTYLFTSNSLGNNVTGEQITSAGGLDPIINSPYTASTLPTCIINVPRVTFR